MTDRRTAVPSCGVEAMIEVRDFARRFAAIKDSPIVARDGAVTLCDAAEMVVLWLDAFLDNAGAEKRT